MTSHHLHKLILRIAELERKVAALEMKAPPHLRRVETR
jgi:hypothetical protein